MKFRADPIVYRAVCEGLIQGLQEANRAADVTPNAVVATAAAAVMAKLHEVLVFDEDQENLLNLQHIAEEMATPRATEATEPPTPTTNE